jgi:hypothetical protein
MSRENVKAVLRVVAAYNAGDLDPLREVYDPSAVMHHLDGWPEPGPSVGRDAVMRTLVGLREAWTSRDQLELLGKPIGVGNRVLMRAVWHVSGQVPDQTMGFSVIYTFRKSKVILQEYFWNHAEALEAAGLKE